MDDIAIRVEDVSKVFKLPHEKHSSIKSTVVNFYRRKKSYELQKALKDVSFEVKKGEFFGIIGRNGSGKSTMLKTLAGIYAPTTGSVQINGKLTPFIELGVGFNPELSGRDNVFLNGALLGFNRKEMQAMYDDIVEFAELEKFMDQRLKNYSSGMQVRLAFSIAIRAKSDILLIDEVLAVGDEAFQRKCLDIFEQYKASKKTVVLVTHDMDTIRKFCDRALLVNDGELVAHGLPRKIANLYTRLNEDAIGEELNRTNPKTETRHLKATISNSNGSKNNVYKLGEKLLVDIKLKDIDLSQIESVGINIIKQSGEHLTGINSRTAKSQKWKISSHLKIEFDLNITPGAYYVLVELFKAEGTVLDSTTDGLAFKVSNMKMPWSGLIELSHRWVVDK